jgi:hypothetical protein
MSNPATLEIVIAPALDPRGERVAGRFDARLGGTVIVRAVATPFYDSARALLEQGLAKPDDMIVMRHAGMHHTVLEATVGKAARLAETQGPRRAHHPSGPRSTHR